MPGPLGCGRFGAFLVHRTDPFTILEDLSNDVGPGTYCTRVLNGVSEAELTVQECYAGREIIPWVHMIRFSWDEHWFWLGPVTKVVDQSDGTGMISCEDKMGFMRKRKLRDDFSSLGAPVDITTIFTTVVSDGFAQDAVPFAPTITASATGVTGERSYSADDHKYILDIIDELSTTGIDYTVILDTLVCGNLDISTSPIGVLNLSHLVGKPEITLDGTAQATFATVVGDGVVGLAQDAAANSTYGILDLVEHESSIVDQTSVDQAAATRRDLLADSPRAIGDLVLQAKAPLDLDDLIPGAVITVDLPGSFAPYVGDVRMNKAKFDVVEGEWQVTLTAQPVGTESL